jgi:hypothetical protein
MHDRDGREITPKARNSTHDATSNSGARHLGDCEKCMYVCMYVSGCCVCGYGGIDVWRYQCGMVCVMARYRGCSLYTGGRKETWS